MIVNQNQTALVVDKYYFQFLEFLKLSFFVIIIFIFYNKKILRKIIFEMLKDVKCVKRNKIITTEILYYIIITKI